MDALRLVPAAPAAAGAPYLPPEAPLAMPVQSLREGARAKPIADSVRRDCGTTGVRVRRDVAAQRDRRLRDVPGAGGRRADHAGNRDPRPVRHPVRMDRVLVCEPARRSDRTGDRPHHDARHSVRRPALACDAHGAPVPDLQRRAASRTRTGARDLRVRRRDRRGGPVRHLHSQRHDRPRHLHRRGSGLPGVARAAAGCPRLLSPPPQERCQEGRQHRRMAAALRRPLRADDRARRRLADDRRHAGAARCRDGAQSKCRADPDLPGHGQCDHSVRPRAAVRRTPLWAADRLWACLVARRRQQLLGPQRGAAHARIRGVRGPARS